MSLFAESEESDSSLSLSLPLFQDYQQQMHKLDGQIQEVNGWINGAERQMNEIDSQGPSDVLKVILYIYFEAFFPMSYVSFMPLVKTVYTPNICILGPAGATCRAGTH